MYYFLDYVPFQALKCIYFSNVLPTGQEVGRDQKMWYGLMRISFF